MQRRHKDLLRGIATELRLTLIGDLTAERLQRGDLDRELERSRIAPDGTITLLDALPPLSRTDTDACNAAIQFLNSSVRDAKREGIGTKRREARHEFIERAAYTWVNRLLALRVMEARGLINETLRHNPDYEGISEALYILRHDSLQRCRGADGGWWAVIEDACAAQIEKLPGLFDAARSKAALLRPSVAALC